MVILILFAVLSGIVTILSPCILPILPIVLSSSAASERARPLGLIAGLIVSFSVFTLIIARIVSLLGIPAEALRLLSVAVLVLIGLSMIVPALTVLSERLLGFLPGLVKPAGPQETGFGAGFLTGATLGLIWAPCAGPILSAVIVVAATQSLTLTSALVVFAFSLGAGIPLLAITYGGRALIQRVRALAGNLLRIQRIFGGIVILTAVLIAFNLDTAFTAWASGVIPPGWTTALSSFENSPAVQQQLALLRGGSIVGGGAPSQPLGDYGPGRDFVGATGWINSPPLTLDQLKGKVVLVDFWTYSCINCIRTFPYLLDWYAKYAPYGFVIVGVHTPEFAFEHDAANVTRAARQFGITYPVVQDNNYIIWGAYLNNYWPAEYLLDATGEIRHYQFGEGNYAETEKAIQALLAEAGHPANLPLTNAPAAAFSSDQTPETYLGTDRLSRFASPESTAGGQAALFSFPTVVRLNEWALSGMWIFQPQFAQETAAGAQLELHFYAQDVYLVMTSDQPAVVTIASLSPNLPNTSEDVNVQGQIMVMESRLYHLVHFDKAVEGTVILTFETPGVQAYSFTFGG
jgi:cytochrome c biogenesis protein CcdA/thiol-disulfide isomerase/thioredoxin